MCVMQNVKCYAISRLNFCSLQQFLQLFSSFLLFVSPYRWLDTTSSLHSREYLITFLYSQPKGKRRHTADRVEVRGETISCRFSIKFHSNLTQNPFSAELEIKSFWCVLFGMGIVSCKMQNTQRDENTSNRIIVLSNLRKTRKIISRGLQKLLAKIIFEKILI